MLSFDAEVLSALFARMNAALWPAQLAFGAAALAALVFAALRQAFAARAIGVILVTAWLCCGLIFHLTYFAGLSFTAPVYGGLFLAQAALLAWSLLVRGKPVFALNRGLPAWVGLLVVGYALVAVPVIALSGAGGLAAARTFGLAPGPTAVFTLGLLLLIQRHCPLHLLVLPVLWCLIAGATAWSLWIPEDLALPFIALAVLAVALWHNRTQAASH
ncbi:hypothetical protein HBA54_25355 [Pelagibius litoralis]|uniref:Uncharacterized protein n=1 Tax=Pelagibius litoralis TaxID=374515 RepID=A0A967F2Y7_9PROT|nr:DUF6064 family protein [Pelagibius litoralis]NIA71931.1 hypothetical protein [Pelagibius litoralis]